MALEIVLENIASYDSGSTNPIERITLSDEENRIVDDCVYVNSWLDALEEGSNELMQYDKIEVDLIDEPDPLVFEWENARIKISYRQSSIFVDNVEEIRKAVKDTREKLASTPPPVDR